MPQGRHGLPESEAVPGGQGTHEAEPAAGAEPDEHDVHTTAPTLVDTIPLGHGKQATAPELDCNKPGSHGEQ